MKIRLPSHRDTTHPDDLTTEGLFMLRRMRKPSRTWQAGIAIQQTAYIYMHIYVADWRWQHTRSNSMETH